MRDDMARTVSVDDEDILKAFDYVNDPVRTVPKMSEDLDLGKDALRKRLKKLESAGEVVSKDVGARSVVWWRCD